MLHLNKSLTSTFIFSMPHPPAEKTHDVLPNKFLFHLFYFPTGQVRTTKEPREWVSDLVML